MDRAAKHTKRQCQFALFSALVVVICVFIGVTMNLTTTADENFDHMGLRTFCMFTVNSNILAAAAMAMLIPYTMDGLRTHNYHIPRWVVDLVYMGVTSVALTFLVSLFVLAPVKGFHLIFSGSRFFLHGVCPILAVVAFCFFMSEKHLRLSDSILSMIPVMIYAVVYYVMVAVVGEERGGWNDFYGFLTRIPSWISMTALLPITFLISSVIRSLHNRSYTKRETEEARFFSELFADADIRKIVAAMARSHSSAKILDIVIPSRVISIMLDYSKSDCSLEECCNIYLKEYLENSEVLSLEEFWI